jgi:Secretion system C-terminal sorting domain
MKKIYIIAISCLGILSAKAQNIFSENFGQPTTSQAIAGYDGFQYESPIVYSGTATVDNTTTASGYPAASGFGNISFSASSSQYLTIGGINTSGFGTNGITLTFGYYKNAPAEDNLKLEVSENGVDFTAVDYVRYSESGWERIQVVSGLPVSTSLSLRFTQTTDIPVRVDDVIVKIESGCPLSFSTSYTVCNASTAGIDTYTAYLPFSGGGTETYGISTTSGIVSGDDPTTVQNGMIQITGVNENVDIYVQTTSEFCDYTQYMIAPQCKPEQELPFYESFNYTAGSSLTTYPAWAESSNGNMMEISEGSLSYSGMTSDYNSCQLKSGRNAFVPFTATSTGTVYSSFMLQASDISNITADQEYRLIAGLTEAGSYNNIKLRLYLQKSGSQLKLGIAPNTTDITFTTASYDVNSAMFVIIAYSYDTNEMMAWVNPNLATMDESTAPTITVTPAAVPQSLGALAFYQSGITVNIDEVKIGTTLPVVTTSVLATTQNQISGFTMYPNPLNGSQLTIVTKNNLQKDVVIYDMMGKQVVNATTQNNSINASLTPGIYLVKVTEDGSTTTKKLVVN